MIKFDLPEGWAITRLEYVCDALRGVTFSSNEAYSVPASNLVGCLTTSAIQDEVEWKNCRFIPRHIASDEGSFLRSGDILVSTANSKELVGKSCLVEDVPFASTFGAFVTTLRVNATEIVDPYFLSQYLRTSTVLKYFYAVSTQTTSIANLRVSELLSLEVPLPTFSEQQRIVAVLRHSAELRQRRREADGVAQNLLPALFNEMFGEFIKSAKGYSLGSLVQEFRYGTSNKSTPEGKPVLRIPNVLNETLCIAQDEMRRNRPEIN